MRKGCKILAMAMVGVAVLGGGCVKDGLYDTPHPDKGAVAVSLQGMAAGDRYVVDMDGQVAGIEGLPFVYPGLFLPGTYRLAVYNCPEGFSFEGRTARVDAPEGKDGTAVIPLPGYLRSVCREVAVVADDTLHVELEAVQRVRDLHIEFTVAQGRPELIQGVTGTLSGIAGAFDLEAGQVTGEAVATVFAFAREGEVLSADVRLLGTMGAAQVLVLDIVFTDGGRTQHTEVDLTEALADFNGDMTTAYRVTGTLETPVGMEEGKGEITEWETVDGGNVSAEM